jgi:streptogramin lyase
MSYVHRVTRHRVVPFVVIAGSLVAALAGPQHALAATGGIVEYATPTAGSQPNGITTGPDGNVWFTEYSSNKIGRITPAGVVTEFTVPTASSGPRNITSGPNGNLWFTEYFGSKIGEITTAGVFTEFPTALNVGPRGIAAGPDGNVWFTEFNANRIGVITTSGTITEYSVPTANSGPRGIDPGPDGNLWFTEYNSGLIGRITTAGVVTEYPIPTPSSGPAHITAGPDGNLWFAENTSGRIGKITTAGVATDYPVTTSGSAPVGIAPGADGNLWFTENSGNNIGEISTSGVVHEFAVPTSASGPQNIYPGADGGLWFTEQTASKVGRVTVGPASLVLSLSSGFTPKLLVATAQAVTVQWLFLGPGANTVTDPSGMRLFSSPSQQPGTSFSFAFKAAGTYAYKDTLTSATGKVAVPVLRSPRTGTTATVFTITWAAAAPAAGFAFDVQIKRPGSSTYAAWQTAVTTTSATFTADAGVGTYSFESRLHDTVHHKTSSYSKPASIAVS